MNFLKKQGYPLENTFVSYYSSIFSAFIQCNLDPVSDSVQITAADLETIDNVDSLKLRFQKGINKQYRDNSEDINECEQESEAS